MAISPVSGNYSNNAIAFKAKEPKLVDVIKHENFEERKYETEASTGKKWGVGIASGFITGLGQAINGQWGKAAGFFFGTMAAGAVAGKLLGKLGAGLVGIAGCAWSIVDAVKNAKSTSTKIISNKDAAPAEEAQAA